MGMASSQARLLHLTSRMHQIEYKAAKLEAEKLQMANQSKRAYEEYLEALESTKVQFGRLTNDGSVGYVDATLAKLENGAVAGYTGETSPTTYLLTDGKNIYVTEEFANAYGITGNQVQEIGTLDEFLADNGCVKEEVMRTVTETNYNDIQSVTPVENRVISAPSTVTVPDADTYSISGTLPSVTDSSIAASTNYTVSGTAPSVNSVAGTSTPIYKEVVTSGVDASTSTLSVNTTSETKTTNFEYLIPAGQQFNKVIGNSYQFNTEDLNLTMQELSNKYGWNMVFTDSTTPNGKELNVIKVNSESLLNPTLNKAYGLNTNNGDVKLTYKYDASTTLASFLNTVANSSSNITFDSSTGILSANNLELSFDSADDYNSENDSIEDYLWHYFTNNNNVKKTLITSSETLTLTSSTKMIDLLQCNVGGNYGDFRICNPDGQTVDCTLYYYADHTHETRVAPSQNFTYSDYLNYLAQDPELQAAGFTWYEDSEGIHTLIGNGYTIKNLTYLNEVSSKLTNEKTTTNTTSVTINRNAIAENIYLARSIINETSHTDYTNNHDAQITSILTEMQNAYSNYSTEENKRQLVLFSEELSTALSSGDTTHIQNALAKLGSTIVSNEYSENIDETITEAGNSHNKKITINKIVDDVTYIFADSAVSITPNSQQVQDGTNDVPGTLNLNGTNAEVAKYLAYQLYTQANAKTYEEYLASIQATGYDAYQLAELVENFDTYKYALAAGTDLRASLVKYDAANYTLTQSSTGYNVTNDSTPASYSATAANTDDILDRLAFDIYTAQGNGNPLTIKNQLADIFNNVQLASLSSYYGSTTWNTIVNNLAASMTTASVSTYTNQFNGYTLTYGTTNDVTINTTTNSHEELVSGQINIPNIDGIASNLVVAFRSAGYTVDETDVKAKLTAKYGTDNNTNNLTLANINEVICNYITNGAGSVASIYNNLYNGAALNITNTYGNDYNATRVNLGVAQVTYGTTEREEGTGIFTWVKDANYEEQFRRYHELKALQGNQYVIVSAELANNPDFVNNHLTQNGSYLLEFSKKQDGTFELKDTSVAVETSLREVDDETVLRKAEAQYEADMLKIDRKDRKYDQDLAALDNERNAIKQEIETLKTVAKENVERTFKLFG